MSVINELNRVLANNYALYLKTQNYHWHVEGPNFKNLHEQFQVQYEDLALQIDVWAERIVILGGEAPGTFNAMMQHSEIKDGDAYKKANEMVEDLLNDQKIVINSLKKLEEAAIAEKDSSTEDMAISRIAEHQKIVWMLSAFLK